MHWKTILGLGGVLGLAATNANADPAADAQLRVKNTAIVGKTERAEGVFEVSLNGDVRHLQSGMVCPGSFPNVSLIRLMVYPTPVKGVDVGCDYARADADGRIVSKLTLFATKAPLSLDQAFSGYKDEITKANPNWRLNGPALNETIAKGPDGKPVTASPLGDFRSAEYLGLMNSRAALSDLIVTVRRGWVFEVRATFESTVSVSAQDQAVPGVGDPVAPAVAFLRIIGSQK